MIKSRLGGGDRAEHLVSNGKKRNAYRILVSNSEERSRLQAGTLVIFLTRASEEQTRFLKFAASLRDCSNRKQRTKINLILYTTYSVQYIYIYIYIYCI